MRILDINGHSEKQGFVAGALDITAERLEQRGCDAVRLPVADAVSSAPGSKRRRAG